VPLREGILHDPDCVARALSSCLSVCTRYRIHEEICFTVCKRTHKHARCEVIASHRHEADCHSCALDASFSHSLRKSESWRNLSQGCKKHVTIQPATARYRRAFVCTSGFKCGAGSKRVVPSCKHQGPIWGSIQQQLVATSVALRNQ